ncbi:MAG TPA: HlyC/CorC family transporter [Pseudomonadales bacterium]|nr:HlyC/CorC family transporter [Pseudomonadales bacterium]HMY96680.1 HlyC/CorC family transporter [Pseudomonadales bacterium]HNF09034.1 HlyC/CorC family transporter [Pseudomonadales bacterium]
MTDLPLSLLLGIMVGLMLVSAFFSAAETGMMALNRYRLKHLDAKGHGGARRTTLLLRRPDRLIGFILIGNNFANNLAASLATILAVRLIGEDNIATAAGIATAITTFALLIFSEATPKTWAALYPERIAYSASWVLLPLLRLFSPLVWLINTFSNGLLYLFGVKIRQSSPDQLSTEELRTVVLEAGGMQPGRHHSMLLRIFELEELTIRDIMIPRGEVIGIDIEAPLNLIIEQLRSSLHTRLPVYRGELNQVVGILHLRNVARFLTDPNPTHDKLLALVREPYFVPESTDLQSQLLHFQHEKRRIGIVADEYGEVLGIVTLEDILEEIVGNFTSNIAETEWGISQDDEAGYLIEGSMPLREINRSLNWHLPTDGPRTLNGLILEQMESIPDGNACIRIGAYQVETVQIKEHQIKIARIRLAP